MLPRRSIACFRNDLEGTEVLFANPEEVVVAWEADELMPALDRVEAARKAGKWAAGYLSYEAGYLLDPALVASLPEKRNAPLLCFGIFSGPVEQSALADLEMGEPTNASIADPRATWSSAKYTERFSRLHRHLAEGDCYQANLTFPVEATWEGDPLALFGALRQKQPVRHSAFIDLDGPVVVSRSPELFFEISRDGWIETLPMKGTAPRGKTLEEDEELREFLRNDPKNQAENRMIVDLLRNDISRISEVGTLDVPELFRIESYATVHQMVSLVRAKLNPGLTFKDILSALFPCGSITGAPKISAMKILRALEDEPRDVYCGSIGWLAPDGSMRFNVAIRTISLFPEGRAVFNIGGGVVFDSTADGEYDECLLKGRFATGEKPAST
jgi:para-aminobenzoate synthetase component 1